MKAKVMWCLCAVGLLGVALCTGQAMAIDPDIVFHVAVVEEPTVLEWTEDDPPVECTNPIDYNVYVEVWATKFSKDLDPDPPHNPGISCAFIDLEFTQDPSGLELVEIEHGSCFTLFRTGTLEMNNGTGMIDEFGACSLAPNGAAVYPEWNMLGRVTFAGVTGQFYEFWAAESTTGCSIYGMGETTNIDYGDVCEADTQEVEEDPPEWLPDPGDPE